MAKFEVRLVIDVPMWALVTVEAETSDEALEMAHKMNTEGEVIFENDCIDTNDAEVTGIWCNNVDVMAEA